MKSKVSQKKDQLALQKIKSGDDNQLAQIYKDYRADFITWLTESYQCSTEEAKDAYQFAIMAFYENVVSNRLVELKSGLKTYLFSIGKRKILELRKSDKLFQQLVDKSVAEDPAMYQSFLLEDSFILSSIPSYNLRNTVIPGRNLKIIGEFLKIFNLKLNNVLGTSIATLYREFKKDDIDLVFKDHLVSIMRIMDKGIKAFDDNNDFKEWLWAKVENLGNRRPIDLLELETGRREVEDAIDRIEYGVYG